ncbi:EAL domain-containing protein [Vibrio maerlii]|uniref:bifunctional diguanylate cyclase/phosphodiesterase n=1 Tax=Vibrio maerlii TaxID=2231648 RepID=UPI000E3D4100|nr:EAL domain-containing protein [Vibrio maerlii]
MQTAALLFDSISELKQQLSQYSSVQPASILVQLFSTQSPEDVSDYSRVLLELNNSVTVIGQSSENLIYKSKRVTNGTIALISTFDSVAITAASQQYSGLPVSDGSALLSALNVRSDTKAIISFMTLTEEGDYPLFKGFVRLGKTPAISGGLAQMTQHGKWVMLNGQVYDQACVAVTLNSNNLHAWKQCFAEWHPVGRAYRVTEAYGRTIVSLDYRPAYEVYKECLSDGRPLTLEQLSSFPLYLSGNIHQQNILHPMKRNEDDSIDFDGEWQIGDEVRFAYSHPSLTVDKVRQGADSLAIHCPESLFIYNCASRLDFIDADRELEPFAESNEVNGVYCMGEFFQTDNRQEILHHSMTYLALREGDEAICPAALEESLQSVSKDQGSLSLLFTLIRKSIADLNANNAAMESRLDQQTKRMVDNYRFDSRTGLLNRQAMKERLAHLGNNDCILTLKLLNFHQVNDIYGYRVGDQLLKELSQHFSERLEVQMGNEASKRLFSIGVGEWAVVFDMQGADSAKVHQRFSRFADEIEHINFEPNGLPEVDYLSVALSGGFARVVDFPNDDGGDILLKAIEARRIAMSDNRHICNAKDVLQRESQRKEQLSWLGCVSRAVLEQNIVTYSQPIFHAHSREQASQECLVRIVEDEQVVSPGLFLPIVEGTHLYNRLSRHMIQSTIEYMANREESFSINLSPQDLLSERTLSILESSIAKLNDPSRLGLEVLESEQIKDYGRMIEVCNHFKGLGTKIMIDDFGSGYSNIDEIIKLNPDIIKLDGSLIKSLDQDPKQRKITNQLVRLCEVFEAKTVAEFVHNQQVCEMVEDMGVDYLQGFYLAEPTRLF